MMREVCRKGESWESVSGARSEAQRGREQAAGHARRQRSCTSAASDSGRGREFAVGGSLQSLRWADGEGEDGPRQRERGRGQSTAQMCSASAQGK